MGPDFQSLLAALRAIAEPTRLRIVALCRGGDLTVSDLCRILGQSQPRISRHLKLLVDAGVLEKLPEGASVFHRIARTGPGAETARNVSAILPEHEDTLRLDRMRLARIRRERESRATKYFNDNAKHWDSLRALHVDDQEVEAAVLDLLDGKHLGDLLDIGTGTGRMLEVLASGCTQAEGVDTSRSMLGIARSRLDRLELGNCHVRQGDMYDLPFPANTFDTVLFHQVLHYADAPESALEEAARVLRPGGRLLMVDFAPHELEELRHEHAHRRLGFPHAEVKTWFGNAGLREQSHRSLHGEPLTVSLWLAEKPTRASAAMKEQELENDPANAL